MHQVTFWGRFAPYSDISSTIESCFTVEELHQKLENVFPELKSFPYTLATNHRLLKHQEQLQGDEPISVMPPFSGG